MSYQQTMYPTLASTVWPADASGPLRLAMLAIIGSAVLAISAKIQIPFWPVPMTMQSFVVLVIGMAYGWRLGVATLLLYLAEGAVGLPVFSRGGGLAYFMGPTGGYLVGFVAAAGVMGWLAERGWDRSVGRTVGAMTIGTLIIFACGVFWLSHLFGLEKALAVGLTPFLAGAVFKIALAAAVLPMTWKMLKR